jgi:hypothetical protein
MADFIASWQPLCPSADINHFSTADYIAYLKYLKKISFSYTVGKKTIFIVYAQTNEFEWTSLPSSTFGGFTISRPVSGDALISFIGMIEAWFIKNTDANTLKISLPPHSSGYSCPDYQFYCLYTQNYSIQACNLSYAIEIKELEFDDLVSQGNLKRIKKCIKENLSVSAVGLERLSNIYEVILNNRRLKGYPMSLSFDILEEQVRLFHKKFKLFIVECDGVVIAAAITIMLSPATLYVLYWGDALEYRSYSPIVLLCREIYQYCSQSNIRYLDIGTSTIDREPNFGLMDFKTDLGFSPNLKFSMQKVIR